MKTEINKEKPKINKGDRVVVLKDIAFTTNKGKYDHRIAGSTFIADRDFHKDYDDTAFAKVASE